MAYVGLFIPAAHLLTLGCCSWSCFWFLALSPFFYVSQLAILNANYMAAKLDGHFNVLYRGREGLSAHEFIVDLRPFKASAGIVEEDVAKRLQVIQ